MFAYNKWKHEKGEEYRDEEKGIVDIDIEYAWVNEQL